MTLYKGLKNAARPYMGNIQREVFPFNLKSFDFSPLQAVKVISKHQPTRPQVKKFLIIAKVSPIWIKIIH